MLKVKLKIMAKKILVTGAAGFIGYHLVMRLLKLDFIVVGLDNINDYYDVNLKYDRLKELGVSKNNILLNCETTSELYSNFIFIKADLENKDLLFELGKKYDFSIIVNLAAQAGVRYSLRNPDAYVQSNVVGFLNILELSRNLKIDRLIYASSSSVYGLNSIIPFSVNHSVDHPVSLYAATKRANELMAHSYSHLYNIQTVGLRFFTVYGPWGRPDMAYYIFAEAFKNKKPIKVFNHGNMKRDFTYIDDIVEGIIKVFHKPLNLIKSRFVGNEVLLPAESSAPFKIYNLGNDSPVKLLDFISEIQSHFKYKTELIFEDIQDGDVENTWADITETSIDLAYEPNISIKDGLGKFMDWYKKYENLN